MGWFTKDRKSREEINFDQVTEGFTTQQLEKVKAKKASISGIICTMAEGYDGVLIKHLNAGTRFDLLVDELPKLSRNHIEAIQHTLHSIDKDRHGLYYKDRAQIIYTLAAAKQETVSAIHYACDELLDNKVIKDSRGGLLEAIEVLSKCSPAVIYTINEASKKSPLKDPFGYSAGVEFALGRVVTSTKSSLMEKDNGSETAAKIFDGLNLDVYDQRHISDVISTDRATDVLYKLYEKDGLAPKKLADSGLFSHFKGNERLQLLEKLTEIASNAEGGLDAKKLAHLNTFLTQTPALSGTQEKFAVVDSYLKNDMQTTLTITSVVSGTSPDHGKELPPVAGYGVTGRTA